MANYNRRRAHASSIFGDQEEEPQQQQQQSQGRGGGPPGEEYQFGLEYNGPPIPGMDGGSARAGASRVPTAERLERTGTGSGITYGNPASPTHTQPIGGAGSVGGYQGRQQNEGQVRQQVIDPTRTRQVAVHRSRVNGVGYGMTLNDCKVRSP